MMCYEYLDIAVEFFNEALGPINHKTCFSFARFVVGRPQSFIEKFHSKSIHKTSSSDDDMFVKDRRRSPQIHSFSLEMKVKKISLIKHLNLP